MPPMPPDFYVPCVLGLVGALGVTTACIKVMWARINQLSDRLAEAERFGAREATAALVRNSEALNAASGALREVASILGPSQR